MLLHVLHAVDPQSIPLGGVLLCGVLDWWLWSMLQVSATSFSSLKVFSSQEAQPNILQAQRRGKRGRGSMMKVLA